jgi:hypothetical protein
VIVISAFDHEIDHLYNSTDIFSHIEELHINKVIIYSPESPSSKVMSTVAVQSSKILFFFYLAIVSIFVFKCSSLHFLEGLGELLVKFDLILEEAEMIRYFFIILLLK